MKSRGLGDDIEKFTKASGIKKLVDNVSKGLNIPCGCASRRDTLNKYFPNRKQ
jgi:hypothetical protein|tara:strand:- start:267 stop:425 length:159 start_codon:yes stop_codon:yes gene_type:complete